VPPRPTPGRRGQGSGVQGARAAARATVAAALALTRADAPAQALSEAYTALFDDESRAAYDRFGRTAGAQGANFDPRAVYAAVFGGPELEPWVGVLAMNAPIDERIAHEYEVSLATQHTLHEQVRQRTREGPPLSAAESQRLRAALHAADELVAEKRALLDVEALKVQDARVAQCARHLLEYVQEYTTAGPAGADALRAKTRRELERLRLVSLGEPMAAAIGYVYVHESRRLLGAHGARRSRCAERATPHRLTTSRRHLFPPLATC